MDGSMVPSNTGLPVELVKSPTITVTWGLLATGRLRSLKRPNAVATDSRMTRAPAATACVREMPLGSRLRIPR